MPGFERRLDDAAEMRRARGEQLGLLVSVETAAAPVFLRQTARPASVPRLNGLCVDVADAYGPVEQRTQAAEMPVHADNARPRLAPRLPEALDRVGDDVRQPPGAERRLSCSRPLNLANALSS